MRRTQDIVGRIRQLSDSDRDPLGIMAADLCVFLDWGSAQEFVTEEAKANPLAARAQWGEHSIPYTINNVREVMRQHWVQAWDHANKPSPTEMNVSLYRFAAWLWLLGDDESDLFARRLWQGYAFYGKPQLIMLGHLYDLGNWREHDNGLWLHGSPPIDARKVVAEEALTAWTHHNRDMARRYLRGFQLWPSR